MPVLQDVSNLQLRVEAMIIGNKGRSLKALTPDESGYFRKFPLMALGIPTRNHTYYDVPSLMRQINDPSTAFNKRLTGSQLYGECGHPYIVGLPQELALARLAHIEEKNWSHQFGGIYTDDKQLEGGGKLLLGDIKPTGATYGAALDQNLRDPTLNTGFSLRAITDARLTKGVSWRNFKNLITFDWVGAGGFEQASKLFASTESFSAFDINVVPLKNVAIFEQISIECFTDTELNEYFGASKIGFFRSVKTVARGDDPKAFAEVTTAKARSHFHEFLKE